MLTIEWTTSLEKMWWNDALANNRIYPLYERNCVSTGIVHANKCSRYGNLFPASTTNGIFTLRWVRLEPTLQGPVL